jgi:methionyl-tRNA synthetase
MLKKLSTISVNPSMGKPNFGAQSLVGKSFLCKRPKVLTVERNFCQKLDTPSTPSPPSPQISNITIDDFMKIDIRVGKIITAEHVPNAEKLLKLTVDIGEAKPRTVFSGIKQTHAPETLIGKTTLLLANLQPRKMRFGISEGMILAAGTEDGKQVFLTTTDNEANVGLRVR